MIIDGRVVSGRVAAIIGELLRRGNRIEDRDVSRVTAYVSARGAVAIGIEERFPRSRPEEIPADPMPSELATKA